MNNITFSGDGKRLAASDGNKGYLFDAASGQSIGNPIDHVLQAWLSDDGTLLAADTHDLGLSIWRCASDGTLSKLAHIDPRTGDAVPEPRAFEALEALRRDIEQACPDPTRPGCASATSLVIRTVIGPRDANAPPRAAP
jgi:WD40 repeat protein